MNSARYQVWQEVHVQAEEHLQPVPAATFLGHAHGVQPQCSPQEHVV